MINFEKKVLYKIIMDKEINVYPMSETYCLI